MIVCGCCRKVFSRQNIWNVRVILCHRCKKLQAKTVVITFDEAHDEHGHRCVSQED